jgi:hypothetical protein
MYAIMYNYANYVQKDFSIQFYTVLYTFWSMAAWHVKTHAVLCTRYSKLCTNLALVFYIMYTICRIMYIIWPRRPQKPSNFVKLCRLWKAVFCFMPFYVTAGQAFHDASTWKPSQHAIGWKRWPDQIPGSSRRRRRRVPRPGSFVPPVCETAHSGRA